MSGHTQGPWQLVDGREGAFEVRADPGGKLVICSRALWPHRSDESLANGRLIAAAPDLLAALKDTLRMLQAAHMQCGIHHNGNKRVIAACAILAKAEDPKP